VILNSDARNQVFSKNLVSKCHKPSFVGWVRFFCFAKKRNPTIFDVQVKCWVTFFYSRKKS
ncbi:hypothetical protein QUF54_10760, partial [Candidatus Marithioploca araucensis]|nr:hypothetical protein [Candidatus Marithioploca araucensis]